MLRQIDDSKVVAHAATDESKTPSVVELCAGMVGIGAGLEFLGCRVVAAMDIVNMPASIFTEIAAFRVDRCCRTWACRPYMFPVMVLVTFVLLGARACVLECVPGAGCHNGLQIALAEFCRRLGWRLSSTNLELASQWPVRCACW